MGEAWTTGQPYLNMTEFLGVAKSGGESGGGIKVER